MNALPSELIEQILSYVDYDPLIVLLRTIDPLFQLDGAFWVEKANVDFNISRTRFWNPNPMDALGLDVKTSNYPRFRYVQLASRKGVVRGSETFLSLEQCIIRAHQPRNHSLMDYFTDLFLLLPLEGQEYLDRTLLKAAMINGDAELFQRYRGYLPSLSQSINETSYFVKLVLRYIATGGNVFIIRAVLDDLRVMLGSKLDSCRVWIRLRRFIGCRHLDLYKEPGLEELNDYPAPGGDPDLHWALLGRFDLIKDRNHVLTHPNLDDEIIEAPRELVIDYLKVQKPGLPALFIKRAVSEGDWEMGRLAKKHYSQEGLLGISFHSIGDSDLLFDLDEEPSIDYVSNPSELRYALEHGMMTTWIANELIEQGLIDVILLAHQLLDPDIPGYQVIDDYLK